MTPDVVVIGAGLAGCSLAWHLSASRRVLVLDQASQPGAEATSQNAGMIRRMGDDPIERALALRTFDFLENPGPDWDEATPSRRTGAMLALGEDTRGLDDAAANLRLRGVRFEACDRPADVAPVLQGSPVHFGWWLPDERVADAHALNAGFVRGIRRHGSAIRCGVEVQAVRVAAGRVEGVETSQGFIPTPTGVLATGAGSARRARSLGLDRPLVPVRRTLLQTAAHPLATPDHPWTWIDDVGLYARPESGGWLVSGCDETVDPPGTGPGSTGPVDAFPRALALDKVERWMPALRDAPIVGGLTGLRTFAPDRRPVFGADPAVEGLWWVAGLGGFGVTCAYAAGEAVAAWMKGESTSWLSPRSVAPGRPLPARWLLHPDGRAHGGVLVGARAELP